MSQQDLPDGYEASRQQPYGQGTDGSPPSVASQTGYRLNPRLTDEFTQEVSPSLHRNPSRPHHKEQDPHLQQPAQRDGRMLVRGFVMMDVGVLLLVARIISASNGTASHMQGNVERLGYMVVSSLMLVASMCFIARGIQLIARSKK